MCQFMEKDEDKQENHESKKVVVRIKKSEDSSHEEQECVMYLYGNPP